MFLKRFKYIAALLLIPAIAGPAVAQEAAPKTTKASPTAKAAPEEPVESEASPTDLPVAENTVDACSDNLDNDNDGHVDCDDQDCEIFALCVRAPAPAPELETEVLQALPMEFAMEAQQLVAISLEGSVG